MKSTRIGSVPNNGAPESAEVRLCRLHGAVRTDSAIPSGSWKFRCPRCMRFLGLPDSNRSARIGNSESSPSSSDQNSRGVGPRHRPRARRSHTSLRETRLLPEPIVVNQSGPGPSMTSSISQEDVTNPVRGEVNNVSVLSKPERFRVMRLTEEEAFVLDELAKRVLVAIKEDPDFRLIFRVAELARDERNKKAEDELEDDIDWEH